MQRYPQVAAPEPGKTPGESNGAWDYYSLLRTTPAEQGRFGR